MTEEPKTLRELADFYIKGIEEKAYKELEEKILHKGVISNSIANCAFFIINDLGRIRISIKATINDKEYLFDEREGIRHDFENAIQYMIQVYPYHKNESELNDILAHDLSFFLAKKILENIRLSYEQVQLIFDKIKLINR
jgi:hypothetical protein